MKTIQTQRMILAYPNQKGRANRQLNNRSLLRTLTSHLWEMSQMGKQLWEQLRKRKLEEELRKALRQVLDFTGIHRQSLLNPAPNLCNRKSSVATVPSACRMFVSSSRAHSYLDYVQIAQCQEKAQMWELRRREASASSWQPHHLHQ